LSAKQGKMRRSRQRRLLLACLALVAWGARAAIDLEVRGATEAVEENIRLHLSKWEELPADNAEDVRARLQPAVTEALQALGYYQAEVSYTVRRGELVLDVEPGPRLQWGEVDIQVTQNGEPVRGGLQEFVSEHPFTKDQAFSHGVYESFKNNLLSFANREGYLDTQLARSRLRINPKKQRADVVLHANVGQRYTISGATFSETRLSEDLLRSIAQVPQGRHFSADLVGEIYNRLLNSGYFAGVNINVDKQPPDDVVLRINLEDLARHRVSAGVGFGTDIGPWVKLRWERPALNERGHNLLAQLQLSEVTQEVTTQYRIPRGHPQNEFVSWDTGWQHKRVEDVETSVLTTGLSYHRVFGEDWRYSVHMDLENETFQQGETQEETSTYVIPSARISRRFFDGDATDPNFGYRYWFHMGFSDDGLGSDTDFQRLNTGVNTIFTFFTRHSVLARLEYGQIQTNQFDQVPLSQRFFTGGDQSVRGFDFETISPRDANGNLTGGQRLNTASLEYRYGFLPNWKAALFVDSGRSYLADDDITFGQTDGPNVDTGTDYRTGAGIGVRWKSPVGFIAVDVATPVDSQFESGVRFHLYLGTPL
jgi:translocation and assembly module TamA